MANYSGFLLCALTFAGITAQAQAPAALKSLPRLAGQINRSVLSAAFRPQPARSVLPLLNTEEPALPAQAINIRPLTIRQSVFTVQSTPDSKHKGSAFAVIIDGNVWGVTARHVLDDIGREPYMTIPDPNGEPLIFPVHPAKEGNANGADAAIFSIPQEARPFILPLELAEELPAAHEILSSGGFARGNFVFQPRREVLFASRYRILTKYEPFYWPPNGYCGSPLLADGKVAGVHIGSLPAGKHQAAGWFSGTLGQFNQQVHDLNIAVPAFWLRMLARQAQGVYTEQEGVPLTFDGLQIALLQPNESIRFIMQLREGRVLKTLPRYPFIDPEHLETFFDVLPGDSFRLEVHPGGSIYPSRQYYWYEWTAGENRVTKTLKR